MFDRTSFKNNTNKLRFNFSGKIIAQVNFTKEKVNKINI